VRKAIEMKGTTVSTTVLEMSDFGFTSQFLYDARRAIVTAVTQNAMITWDGTDPTATLGHPVVANGDWVIIENGANIQRIKLIRQGGSDANVTITLEK